MREEYDFSKATKNPYAKRVKKQLTLRVDDSTIEYFRNLAEEVNVPYQTLINMYLRDCATSRRRLSLKWITAA
jgi:predicted DNA binding CopG/RHH family protein